MILTKYENFTVIEGWNDVWTIQYSIHCILIPNTKLKEEMTVLEHVLGINWFTYILGFGGSLRPALDINFVEIVRNTNYFLSFQNSLLWEITVVTGQRAYQMYSGASWVRPFRKKIT